MNRRLRAANPELLDGIFRKMEDAAYELPADQQARYERVRDGWTYWLSNPVLPENRIRDYLMAHYAIKASTAYQDIYIIKTLFGSVPLANKEMMRHKANHLYDMAVAAAMAGDDAKAKSFTRIADGIVKNNRLDEDDGETIQWAELVPKDFSLTVNPSVIGIDPVPGIREKAAKLLAQYTAEVEGPTTLAETDGK